MIIENRPLAEAGFLQASVGMDNKVVLFAGVCTGAVNLSCVCLVMLTKWFSMTRLETRTKESNIYASIWVV